MKPGDILEAVVCLSGIDARGNPQYFPAGSLIVHLYPSPDPRAWEGCHVGVAANGWVPCKVNFEAHKVRPFNPSAVSSITADTEGEPPARNGSPVPVATLTPADERAAAHARPTPDEGGDASGDFPALRAAYGTLDAGGKSWIGDLQRSATAAGVSFHAKDNMTRRRWEIIRALTLLAQAETIDDETLRDLLEPVVGPVAQYANVPIGHLIGSLSATEAAVFGQLVDGRLAILIDPQGRPSHRPAA